MLPTTARALALCFGSIAGLAGCSFVIPVGERTPHPSDSAVDLQLQKRFYEPGYTFRHAENRLAVYAFDALNAVDIQQSMHASRRPDCYAEANPLTRALIGAHPTPAESAAVLLAGGFANYYLSAFLDSRDVPDADGRISWPWRIARYGFLAFSIGSKANTVYSNAQATPLAPGCSPGIPVAAASP